MNTAPLLLIRADASPLIGTGHVMRCFALAQAWKRLGGEASFLMAESIPAIRARLQAQGIQVVAIPADPGSENDARQTCKAAAQDHAAGCVVDSYRCGPAYHHALKSVGLPLMVIDDDGRFSEYCADLVLNQNLAATEQLYRNRAPSTRLLLGTEYALLRPEFLAQSRERQTSSRARRILVTMGGSDADNVTGQVVQALASCDGDFQATIVIGSGNPHAEELIGAVQKLSSRIQVATDPPNMASLMAACDFTVSAAGSTCWELAYMGMPMIVVVLSRDQQGIARSLDERGVAINLGWHANLSSPSIISAINTIAADAAMRSSMSAAGQKLVDGRGAERVVEVLRNSL